MGVSYRDTVLKGKQAQGKNEMLKHLDGGLLTPREAIKAWCYDCVGFYDDGKMDCERDDCPLHPYMPYNPNRVKGSKGRPGGNLEGLAKARAARAEQAAEDLDNEADDQEEESA